MTRLARNSLWAGFGSYAGLAFIPVTSLILTRLLGVENYGVYSLVQNWGSLVVGICAFGMLGANLRMIPIYVGQNETGKVKGAVLLTTRFVSLSTLLASTIIFIFPYEFCSVFLRRPESMSVQRFETLVIPAFRFYAISILLTGLYQSFLSSLTGLQAIRYRVLANDLVSPAVKTAALIIFLYFGGGVLGALGANIVQDIVIVAMSGWFLLKVFPQWRDTTVRPVYEFRRMASFSAALFADSLLYKYTFQLDVLFLGFFGQISGAGLYTVAQNLQRLIYMPSYAIATTFAPMCGELYSRGDHFGLANIYKTATKWTLTVSLPIFTTFVLFADPILSIFGKEFTAGKSVLLTLACSSLVADVIGMSGAVIISTGHAKMNLLNSSISAGISITLFIVLIPPYGIWGAALAHAFAVIVINGIRLFQVYKLFNIHPFKRSLFKPLAASGLAALVIWGLMAWRGFGGGTLYWLSLTGYVVGYGAGYVFLSWILKLDDADRQILKIISNRIPFLSRFT